MRKILVLILACMVLLSGCQKNNTDDATDTVVIEERLFATQISAINRNTNDYLGKTVELEGIYHTFTYGGETLHYVYRMYADACCVEPIGFYLKWEGDYPDSDSWVNAEGVLERFTLDGANALRLNLSSLTVLSERGAETVTR